MKKDIIIDFDGVLFPTGEATLNWLEQYYGITIPRGAYMCGSSLHHLVSKHLPENSKPVDEYELYRLIGKEFLASMKHHEDIQPMEEAFVSVEALSKKYTLHVATARLTLGKDVVRKMLDKFFPGMISSIHHVWHISDNDEFLSAPKRDFIQKLSDPVLFIDDSPREIEDVSKVVRTALFDPQNHHANTTNTTYRVKSWGEVLEIV